MAKFTLYIKHKGGSKDSVDKAVLLLKTYISDTIAKGTTFDSSDVSYVDDSTSPALGETDAVVYVVRNISKSVISAKGGSVAIAESNTNILGLTDLNQKICEVYFDRLYEGSSKELAGACYHELAHIKSNMDNSMHTNQDGFLKGSPDYNGSPSDSNKTFLNKHIGKKVKQNAGY